MGEYAAGHPPGTPTGSVPSKAQQALMQEAHSFAQDVIELHKRGQVASTWRGQALFYKVGASAVGRLEALLRDIDDPEFVATLTRVVRQGRRTFTRYADWRGGDVGAHLRGAHARSTRPHRHPNATRATRTGRATTQRRSAGMAASASSTGGNDGGSDDLPHDPAPLGAVGRATGSLLNPDRIPPTVSEIHRAEHNRVRERTRTLGMLGALPDRWSSDWGWGQ